MLRPEDVEPPIGPFYFYLDAFKELDSCRNNGPIPFTAIVEYTKLYDVEDVEGFLYIIRRLDGAYLELEAKRAGNKNS